MKKIKAILLIVILALIVSVGCNSVPTADKGGSTFVNRRGVELAIPDSIETIACFSPAVTQVLVDLGLEDKLIAVDEYSLEYIKNQDLPTFDIVNPNPEQLMALGADIFFVTEISRSEDEDPLTVMKNSGTTVVYVPVSGTIEEIKFDVTMVATMVKKVAEGEKLIEHMEKVIEEYRAIAKGIDNRKTVYFEISPSPIIYSFGSGVYLNEALEIIGAENVLADQTGWIMVSAETIVAENPDIILSSVDYIDDPKGEIKNRSGFGSITAVKNDAVFVVSNQTSANSNHRIVDTLEILATTIYPEEYGTK